MAARRANGEGTIYKRKDGRYEAAAYFATSSGQHKRIRVYGKHGQMCTPRSPKSTPERSKVSRSRTNLGDSATTWTSG